MLSFVIETVINNMETDDVMTCYHCKLPCDSYAVSKLKPYNSESESDSDSDSDSVYSDKHCTRCGGGPFCDDCGGCDNCDCSECSFHTGECRCGSCYCHCWECIGCLESSLMRTLIDCKCKRCNQYYYSTILMFACDSYKDDIALALINQLEYNKYNNINNCYSFENDVIKRTAIIFSIARGYHDVALELIKMNKPIDSKIIKYCYQKSSEKALDLIKKTSEASEDLETCDKSDLLIKRYYDESNFGAIDSYNMTVLDTYVQRLRYECYDTINRKNVVIALIATGLDFSISNDDIKKTISAFSKHPHSRIMYNSYTFSYVLQCEYAYARRRHAIIYLNI